jgi:hypothetical protein
VNNTVTPLPPDDSVHLIPCDREEPVVEQLRFIECPNGFKRLDERRLHNIFRGLAILYQSIAVTEQTTLVFFVQRRERRLVSCTDPVQQFCIRGELHSFSCLL